MGPPQVSTVYFLKEVLSASNKNILVRNCRHSCIYRAVATPPHDPPLVQAALSRLLLAMGGESSLDQGWTVRGWSRVRLFRCSMAINTIKYFNWNYMAQVNTCTCNYQKKINKRRHHFLNFVHKSVAVWVPFLGGQSLGPDSYNTPQMVSTKDRILPRRMISAIPERAKWAASRYSKMVPYSPSCWSASLEPE